MKTFPPNNVAALDRINLRLSARTFAAMDAARSVRPGNVSRNTWIAEAIEERLARDVASSSPQLRRAKIA